MAFNAEANKAEASARTDLQRRQAAKEQHIAGEKERQREALARRRAKKKKHRRKKPVGVIGGHPRRRLHGRHVRLPARLSAGAAPAPSPCMGQVAPWLLLLTNRYRPTRTPRECRPPASAPTTAQPVPAAPPLELELLEGLFIEQDVDQHAVLAALQAELPTHMEQLYRRFDLSVDGMAEEAGQMERVVSQKAFVSLAALMHVDVDADKAVCEA